MPYGIEDQYRTGVPSTFLQGGLASRGIVLHWTAGGIGRQGALDTVQFFIDRADRNASYHEIWWWEAASQSFGVIRVVPIDRAAHSMNPTPPDYSPNAEVRRILGDRVGDPNAWSFAASFAGMPADLDAARQHPYFLECCTRRVRELLAQETTIRDPRPLFNHGWAQPSTRQDAGPDLIPAIYNRLFAPIIDEEDLMARTWRPKYEEWDSVPSRPFYTAGQTKAFGATSVVIKTFLEEIEIDAAGAVTTPRTGKRLANYPDPINGPEVLIIPRTSLANGRNGRLGLPLNGGMDPQELLNIQKAADEAGFFKGRAAAADAASKVTPPQ